MRCSAYPFGCYTNPVSDRFVMFCRSMSRSIMPNVLIRAKATSSCSHQRKRSLTRTRRSRVVSGLGGSSTTLIARPHEYFDRTGLCDL